MESKLMDIIDRLLEHDCWATTRLLELCRNLPDAQLDQEFDIGHRTLRETLGHLIYSIGYWTGQMTAQPIDMDRRSRDYSMDALIERHRQFQTAFASVMRRMRDEHRLEETFIDRFGLPTTFGGTVIQVPMHNVEHRSEALHMLQRLGLPDVPELDHLLWEHATREHERAG